MNAKWLWLVLIIMGLATPAAWGQTALPQGHQITLLPGYEHQPLQGIDSTVGRIVKKDGLTIMYTMGPVAKPGAPIFSGTFINAALAIPEAERAWLKEQAIGGRKVYAAYGEKFGLSVSVVSATEGVNFTTKTKNAEEIAEVLLMALTLTEAKEEKK